MSLRLLLLLAAAGAGRGDVAQSQPQALTPSSIYYSTTGSSTTVWVPGLSVQGGKPLQLLGSVSTAIECDAACRRLPQCSVFQHCSRASSCKDDLGGTLIFQQCKLLGPDCKEPALKVVPGDIQSGFPVHPLPEQLEEYGVKVTPAQGIVGADYDCPPSIEKGMCAFASVYQALLVCSIRPDMCFAIIVYQDGLDGCSPGALRAVLKTEYSRPGNQFVAPYVHTLVISKPDKPEAPLYRYNHLLYADEAEFVPPSDAEMAAAAPAATGNSSTSDAYHGCAVAKGALWAGNVTGLLQGVASPIDCCRECHARLGPATNGTQPCNLWHYCPANQKGSCIYRLIDRNDTAEADTSLQRNYTLQPGQCELRYQELAGSALASLPWIIAKGPDVPFIAGAPVAAWGPELSGYERLPGRGMFTTGCYVCADSLSPETGTCMRAAALSDLAHLCDTDQQCAGFRIKGSEATTEASRAFGLFSNDTSAWQRVLVPTTVLYVQQAQGGTAHSGSSSSGELSSGTIAGIVVGSIAVVGMAALAGAAVWRHKRRRTARVIKAGFVAKGDIKGDLEAGSTSGEEPEGSSSGGEGEGEVGSSQSGNEGQPNPAAALPPLVELLAHVELQDAKTLGLTAPATDPSKQPSGHRLMSAATLPEKLRDWVVDPEQVTYVRAPNGQLWELGSGGWATIYKAQWNGEAVAAKELDIGASAAVQESFIREAGWLQSLRHANLVTAYGCMLIRRHEKDRGVLLLEWCEGRDLRSALEVTAAGTSDRLFGWYRKGRRAFMELATALNYLHAQGVVHMDVKSSNVLLTASGTAKLADVGLARLQSRSALSQQGVVVGTWAWTAPEVLLGRKCTSKVDIYSAGIVLWEIITGEWPQRGTLRSPRVPRECPQEAVDLMMACLSDDPAARPTAQQLMQRLAAMQPQRKRRHAAVHDSELLLAAHSWRPSLDEQQQQQQQQLLQPEAQ